MNLASYESGHPLAMTHMKWIAIPPMQWDCNHPLWMGLQSPYECDCNRLAWAGDRACAAAEGSDARVAGADRLHVFREGQRHVPLREQQA